MCRMLLWLLRLASFLFSSEILDLSVSEVTSSDFSSLKVHCKSLSISNQSSLYSAIIGIIRFLKVRSRSFEG